MPQEQVHPAVGARVRRLAEFLTATGAVRARVERPDCDIEVTRLVRPAATASGEPGVAGEVAPLRVETIAADLVGIFRFARPAPQEAEELEGDRELGYVEALGIRNPVRSLGAGRIVAIPVADGAAVEFGQPLFLLDRG